MNVPLLVQVFTTFKLSDGFSRYLCLSKPIAIYGTGLRSVRLSIASKVYNALSLMGCGVAPQVSKLHSMEIIFDIFNFAKPNLDLFFEFG